MSPSQEASCSLQSASFPFKNNRLKKVVGVVGGQLFAGNLRLPGHKEPLQIIYFLSSSTFEKIFKAIVMSNVGSLRCDPENSISSGTQLTHLGRVVVGPRSARAVAHFHLALRYLVFTSAQSYAVIIAGGRSTYSSCSRLSSVLHRST